MCHASIIHVFIRRAPTSLFIFKLFCYHKCVCIALSEYTYYESNTYYDNVYDLCSRIQMVLPSSLYSSYVAGFRWSYLPPCTALMQHDSDGLTFLLVQLLCSRIQMVLPSSLYSSYVAGFRWSYLPPCTALMQQDSDGLTFLLVQLLCSRIQMVLPSSLYSSYAAGFRWSYLPPCTALM